jgi:phage FluMu protein Com
MDQKCPRCKSVDSFAQMGQFDARRPTQYGYVVICKMCNYKKSSFSKKQMDPGGEKKGEMSYKFAPQQGNYIAPVMPFQQFNKDF